MYFITFNFFYFCFSVCVVINLFLVSSSTFYKLEKRSGILRTAMYINSLIFLNQSQYTPNYYTLYIAHLKVFLVRVICSHGHIHKRVFSTTFKILHLLWIRFLHAVVSLFLKYFTITKLNIQINQKSIKPSVRICHLVSFCYNQK